MMRMRVRGDLEFRPFGDDIVVSVQIPLGRYSGCCSDQVGSDAFASGQMSALFKTLECGPNSEFPSPSRPASALGMLPTFLK